MERNIFEIATREGLRFPYKGLISVEDLWVLPLKSLDSVFKVLNSELKKTTEESLLEVKSKEDNEIAIKIEIVKHIVNVKLEEEKARNQEREVKEQKQKIMELISNKKNADLENKSIEELQAMLSELN